MTGVQQKIVILDFGSQYTQLIARRVREAKVYCEILPYNTQPDLIYQPGVAGIILSGSPASVSHSNSPKPHRSIFSGKLPVLGICYGYQLLSWQANGDVTAAQRREYGPANLRVTQTHPLFEGLEIGAMTCVWMSHGDYLEKIPPGYEAIAETDNSPFAAIAHIEKPLLGLQFHPEVTHTAFGMRIIQNFLLNICHCSPDWTPDVFVTEAIQSIRSTIGQGKVLCGLSGGVDSAVVTMLLDQAAGTQLVAMLIDNGIMREGEVQAINDFFKPILKDRFQVVDAQQEFFQILEGVTDPEKKRKAIGEKFIRVFERESKQFGHFDFLAQGTLYPDIIESAPINGPSMTIKSHHNVGGLPEKMNLKLVEPLRNLFKDEVRSVGKILGLPDEIVWRQPFPGPGLAVRILGEVTPDRVKILQKADTIVRQEINKAGLMKKLWQAFAVLLPIRTVGVMGDERTYDYVCAVRTVTSTDAMTADWGRIPHELLANISNRISNEVKGINRVVYDISSKPPATIEWE